MVDADDLIHLLSNVSKYEGYYLALCPYHDDNNPSLLVGNDGWFKCLACGERGTNDKLYKRIYTGKFADLSETISDKFLGFTPAVGRSPQDYIQFVRQSRQDLDETPDIQNYWLLRGISREDCALFHLGIHQGAWASVPMYDRNMDQPLRITLRAFHHTLLDGGIRYWNSPGKPILFVPRWNLVRAKSKIAVCYGIIDALACNALGYACVTPSSGKDSLKIKWLKELGAKEYYFIPDMGEERTAIKHIRQTGSRASLLKLPYLEHGCSDPADYFQAGKQEVLREILGRYLNEEEESKDNLS